MPVTQRVLFYQSSRLSTSFSFLPRHLSYCSLAITTTQEAFTAPWYGPKELAPGHVACTCTASYRRTKRNELKVGTRRLSPSPKQPRCRSGEGRMFIGFLTYQTTGFCSHVAGRSIPHGGMTSFDAASRMHSRTKVESLETL